MNYNEFLDSLSSSYRNLLSKLTSASSEAPPGYLLNELVEFVRTDLSKLNEIEEYLVGKLARKEPYVKLKCLKLLRHLCVSFPRDFIRPKVTQSQAVLDCKTYKAPYSEYNGDSLSRLVRAEFEELIKVVCSYDSALGGAAGTAESKMVGFGNAQYNQPGSYQSPGLGNPNPQSQPPYGSQHGRGPGGYGNSGMMGFGNPNMPPPQRAETNTLSALASNLTPAVSEIKNAGNSALKMISEAANRYLPSDLVEKIERVGSAITSTATEQFEKYLGGRAGSRAGPHGLNNSMYGARGHQGGYQGGFGSNYAQPGYGSAGPGSYNPAQINAVGYTSQTHYGQQPPYGQQGYTNPQLGAAQFGPPQTYSAPQGFGSAHLGTQHLATQQSLSSVSSCPQGFPPLPHVPSSAGTLSHTSSVGAPNLQTQPSIDLFAAAPSAKFTVPGERESAFVKEMLTFTGIKVSPSPRLIEEYLARVREMDKRLVVDELLKHLNLRAAKWQTHFRILCILEALLLRGGLDGATVAELKSTAAPIFEKCREEQQLASKAAKLSSLLAGMDGSLLPGDAPPGGAAREPDLLAGQHTAVSSTRTEDLIQTEDFFAQETRAAQGGAAGGKAGLDPAEAKASEFDLFFNSADGAAAPSARPEGAPKPADTRDPFDFDSLSFGSAPGPGAEAPRPQHSIVSNIDNNLDLFDNTDFSLERRPEEAFGAPRSGPAAPSHSLDLI